MTVKHFLKMICMRYTFWNIKVNFRGKFVINLKFKTTLLLVKLLFTLVWSWGEVEMGSLSLLINYYLICLHLSFVSFKTVYYKPKMNTFNKSHDPRKICCSSYTTILHRKNPDCPFFWPMVCEEKKKKKLATKTAAFTGKYQYS